jgi:polysaccharide export outer membrane protein
LGSETIVTLTSLRDIQVLMIGMVERSGIYTIAGGSTVLSALNVAGGISENGTYRNIELIRNGEVIRNFDLYDFLVFGNNEFLNYKLRAGDAVRVNAANFHVPVTGGVNTPAIYELKSGETIEDVISFASGFSQDHFGFDYLDVFRSSATKTDFISVTQENFKEFVLLPRDTLLVPSFDNEIRRQKKIEILGRVENPGTYFIRDGEKLSDLISRAGGYRDDAYIFGASLFRKNAINLQEVYATRMYADTIAHVVGSIGRPDAYLDERMLPILQEELKTINYDGRLVTTFDLDELKADPSKDIVLEDGDKILIPQLDKVVYLFGDFANPSNFRYEPGFKPDDYMRLAGGSKEGAEDYVIIVNPDGTSQAYKPGLLKLRPPSIYPGSIIYAPRNVGRLDGIEFAGTLAPILSSLAISLASLNSIND